MQSYCTGITAIEFGALDMVTSADVDTLVEQVRWFLSQLEEPVSEHDLIAEFAYEKAFADLEPGSAIHRQSQRHFLIMHVLYTLKEQVEGTGNRLQMRPDAIRLFSNAAPSRALDDAAELEQMEPPENEEAMREYYLDFSRLGATETAAAEPHHPDLYHTLDLKAGADWQEVQAAYREKAAENHPENGGNAADFHRVKEAYRELSRVGRF